MQIEISPIQTIPLFSMNAPLLREAVDLIADRAMEGIEQINQAMATAPVETQKLLNELRTLFCSIGHSADSTSDDVGADLDQVWGVGVARAGNHEMVVANSSTFDKPEAA